MVPVLIGLSFVLLGRSFYLIYVKKRSNRAGKVLTWLAAAFVVVYWTWQWFLIEG